MNYELICSAPFMQIVFVIDVYDANQDGRDFAPFAMA